MRDIKDTKGVVPSFEPKTDPFGDNLSGEHAYKRTERIVSATYLVTNHIPHEDPIRARIRDIGHELLSGVLALHGGFRAATHEKIARLLALVRESISLVRLLHLSGYVSAQNALLLSNALDELGQFLSGSQASALSDSIQLDREDFLPRDASLSQPLSRPRMAALASPITTTAASPSIGQSVPVSSNRKIVRSPGRSVQTEVHGERRRALLDILARSGALGIKDITSQMVGCSEKTVQRELSMLVRERTVKKEGQKRWSTYKLA